MSPSARGKGTAGRDYCIRYGMEFFLSPKEVGFIRNLCNVYVSLKIPAIISIFFQAVHCFWCYNEAYCFGLGHEFTWREYETLVARERSKRVSTRETGQSRIFRKSLEPRIIFKINRDSSFERALLARTELRSPTIKFPPFSGLFIPVASRSLRIAFT